MPRHLRQLPAGMVFHVHEHLLTACRHMKRNALSAGLVERAEEWRWGSQWTRRRGAEQLRAVLSEGPVQHPADWV